MASLLSLARVGLRVPSPLRAWGSDMACQSFWRARRAADRSNLDRNQILQLWSVSSSVAGPGFLRGCLHKGAAWTVELSRVPFEVLKGDG